MRLISRACSLVLLMVGALAANASCRCPEAALSSHLLVSVPAATAGMHGLVACGHEDARQATMVIASEFQIFRCESSTPVLEFGALQSAQLRARGAALEVVEVERWPFGRDWKWMDVPVERMLLSAQTGDVTPTAVRCLSVRRCGRRRLRASCATTRAGCRLRRAFARTQRLRNSSPGFSPPPSPVTPLHRNCFCECAMTPDWTARQPRFTKLLDKRICRSRRPSNPPPSAPPARSRPRSAGKTPPAAVSRAQACRGRRGTECLGGG